MNSTTRFISLSGLLAVNNEKLSIAVYELSFLYLTQ